MWLLTFFFFYNFLLNDVNKSGKKQLRLLTFIAITLGRYLAARRLAAHEEREKVRGFETRDVISSTQRPYTSSKV